MNTFLDLLILVVMVLAAVSLLAVVLMFLVKNPKVRRVCLWIVAALGVYVGYVGVRIMWINSAGQTALAVLLALVGIGAVVLERVSRGNEKRFLIARIMASAALVAGMLNAFM
ncbi:MAG: hypothetical protein E7446_02365 [Ruminococcaceae bacterium]|nr:hypothetical protein [Oscillospiraceae bacterium]